MGLFTFMHHECSGAVAEFTIDEDVDGLVEARTVALRIARSIMSEEIAQGRLCLSCWIVVKNDSGHNVLTVQFGDAVELIDHPSCSHDVLPADGQVPPNAETEIG